MIEWTFSGIVIWIAHRALLLAFYYIIGLFLLLKYRNVFKNSTKNLLYSFSFVSFLVGFWELPLFLFNLIPLSIYFIQIIVYMMPFPIMCKLLKIKFSLGRREILLFISWLASSIIAAEMSVTIDWIIWAWYVTYIFRFTTFIFLFKIFKLNQLQGSKH